MDRPLDIIVCQSPTSFSQDLWNSLLDCRAELRELCSQFVTSANPRRNVLADILDGEALPHSEKPEFRHAQQSPVVEPLNIAMRHAAASGHDVFLVSGEATFFPGTLGELARIASGDEMIGFVSPRSNGSSFFGLPCEPVAGSQTREDSHAAFLTFSRCLPDHFYVPQVDPACVFFKGDVLQEFGFLKENLETLSVAVYDFVLRANRSGYRCAMANRAFVHYLAEPSARDAGVSESRHLRDWYQEFQISLDRYAKSSYYEAERTLAGLVPGGAGRLDIVFDFSNFQTHHCGTFELSKKLLAAALHQWNDRFHIHAMISDEARRFHGLDDFERLSIVPASSDKKFAVALHLAQPVRRHTLTRMSRLAAVNVYAMLDPIALDCQYLSTSAPDDLYDLWGLVTLHADAVIYISDFVRRQFERRLRRRPNLRELVAYPSLNPAEYVHAPLSSAAGRHLLVVGNNFEHKRMHPTVSALVRDLPGEQIVALGLDHFPADNVLCYPSGGLSDQQIEDLYRHSTAIIYPSLYEGFGLPVLKALGYEKPVYARSIGAILETRERVPFGENIHVYSSTPELIECLRSARPEWRRAPNVSTPQTEYGWDSMAVRVGSLVEETLEGFSVDNVLIPRIEALRMWTDAPPPEMTSSPAAEVELLPAAPETPEAPAPTAPENELTSALMTALEDRDRQIAAIHNSWSWRLTAPVRIVGGWYLRFRSLWNGDERL